MTTITDQIEQAEAKLRMCVETLVRIKRSQHMTIAQKDEASATMVEMRERFQSELNELKRQPEYAQ